MKFQHSFIMVLCAMFTVPIHANTLIITRGPISSGMGGYLSNAISSLDSSYYAFSQNDILRVVHYKLFDDMFPQQMAIIRNAIEPENIAPAITNYHICFKHTVYEQQKQHALAAIAHIRQVLNAPENEYIFTALHAMVKHLTMAELSYHAACGHNLVWEGGTVYNFDEDAAAIKECFSTVIETVTANPPATMLEQWYQRNALAINEKKAFDRRLIKRVLTTFFNNFQPADEYQDPVITLSRDEFDIIIAQAAEYIQTVPREEFGENGIFTRSEFTLEELFEFAEHIYAELDFENNDYVFLAPSLECDVLLSSKEECLQFAQDLIYG